MSEKVNIIESLPPSMEIDERKLRQYLLGSSSHRDEEDIDMRLIADEQFGAVLEHLETELIREYLDDELSPEENVLFLENFLNSSRRKSLVNEMQMLHRTAMEKTIHEPEEGAARARSKPGGIFSVFARPAFAGPFVLIVALLAGISWLYLGDPRTPLEKEYAQLNRTELNDAAKTSQLYNFNLIGSSNFRDTAGTAAYPYSKLTDRVVFRLALVARETEGGETSVVIEKAGLTFVVQNARVFVNPFGSELRFLAPKSILQPGHYLIRIERKDGRYENAPFQFRIE